MKILTILPPREGFSPDAFGAVSLSVRDFTLHSRFRESVRVVGLSSARAFEGVDYACLKLKRRWYERQTRAYIRAILHEAETFKPALLEVHNRPALALALAKRTPIPVVLHLHNDPQEMRAARNAKERTTLLKHLRVVCVSDWVRTRFLEGVSASQPLFLAPCGIEMPDDTQTKVPEIVYVGRMTPNKGVLEAVQAMAMVLPEFPQWRGRVIGGRRHSVSAQLSAYEQQITDAATDAIHIDGFQPYDVTQEAIAKAQIMVVPSLWDEPFGRTALEGLAHGCAVITSGHGGLREVVADKAHICEVTPHALAEAMRALMADEQARRQLQADAPAQAARYRIDICAGLLDDAREAIVGAAT